MDMASPAHADSAKGESSKKDRFDDGSVPASVGSTGGGLAVPAGVKQEAEVDADDLMVASGTDNVTMTDQGALFDLLGVFEVEDNKQNRTTL